MARRKRKADRDRSNGRSGAAARPSPSGRRDGSGGDEVPRDKEAAATTAVNELQELELSGEALFKRALALQRKGKGLEAERLYETLLRKSPRRRLDALLNLGVLRHARGERKGARECFAQVLASRPDDASAHYNMGRLLLEERRRREALKHLVRAVELDPSDMDAVSALCDCYFELGESSIAMELVDALLERKPEDEKLLLKKAELHLRKGEFPLAEKVLSPLTKDTRRPLEVFALLGECAFHRGSYRQAVQHLKRALLHGETAHVRKYLAASYGALGEHEKAAQELEAARRLEPALSVREGDVQGLLESCGQRWDEMLFQRFILGRSSYWAERGDWQAAVSEFLIYTSKYPGEPIVWQELAAAYEAQGEYRRARRIYEKVHSMDPSSLEVLMRLVSLSVELGDTRAARRWLAVALERAEGEEVAELLALHAEVELADGRSKAAMELFERALSLDYGLLKARLGLAVTLRKEGRADEAVGVLMELLDTPGASGVRVLAELTAAMEEAGRGKELLDVLERRRSMFEEEPLVRVVYARLLAEAGRREEARREYAAVVELLDDASGAGASRRRRSAAPSERARGRIALLEALLFLRRPVEARKLFGSIGGSTRTGAAMAFFDMLTALLSKNATRFSVALQRVWSDDPGLLPGKVPFLCAFLERDELSALARETESLKRLFRKDPSTLAAMDGFRTSILYSTPSLTLVK